MDLGLPRNVAPELKTLGDNLRVLDLDDLKHLAGLTAQVVMQRSIIASCPTLPAAAIAPSAPPQAQPLTIPGGVANSAPDALKG